MNFNSEFAPVNLERAAKERAKLAYLPCPKHQDSNFNFNPNKIEGLRLLSLSTILSRKADCNL